MFTLHCVDISQKKLVNCVGMDFVKHSTYIRLRIWSVHFHTNTYEKMFDVDYLGSASIMGSLSSLSFHTIPSNKCTDLAST